ncbi:MAG: hypothetical protein RIK87_17075 [Fuerstiella sp.]
MRLSLCILILAACDAAVACNIPVFRYALERWQADPAKIIVFHKGPLSDAETATVAQLEAASASKLSNIEIVKQQIDQTMDDSVGLLWDELSGQSDVTLPYVVVRSSVADRLINCWRGPLNQVNDAQLLQSPVRERLADRFLAGDAAVWLVVKSNDSQRNTEVLDLLNEQLTKLGATIPLPEGIGLPGSELFAGVPLLMRFSVLEIDPDDPDEAFLIHLLQGFDPEAVRRGEPLVVPVFGRGRALEVIPADQIDAGLIEDLTLFLCGPCSCQVKERNPGFDLLMSVNWDRRLFGDDDQVRPTVQPDAGTDAVKPILVEIPPGQQSDDSVPPKNAATSADDTSPTDATEPIEPTEPTGGGAADSVVTASTDDEQTDGNEVSDDGTKVSVPDTGQSLSVIIVLLVALMAAILSGRVMKR